MNKLTIKCKAFWENNKPVIVVVGLILFLALGAFLIPKKQYPPVSAERLATDPYLGSENAPVTIIEYADFACSGCKLWHNAGVLEEILEQFDGQVKYVWRDNAHISSASRAAANAAQCAYDQGKFWDYHDILFENPIGFSDEGLKSYALMLDMDAEKFNTCVDQGLYMDKVVHSMNLAGEHGLSQTPSFLVNEVIIIGPPATSYLADLISKLMEE
ncbi:MAG: thioredoxin domain-containing protein [Anaerolineaceae bacterium]|nr:thioredoxin domain-containing protein [Anaerolineaceae bacterium]